jgi:hypothetical protein
VAPQTFLRQILFEQTGLLMTPWDLFLGLTKDRKLRQPPFLQSKANPPLGSPNKALPQVPKLEPYQIKVRILIQYLGPT